ncbi:hypothetical protein [Bacillus phage FI_KG-Lek]|nr:hypothetical protein [Bacillus phage FI_KG-Lek]
MLVLGLRSSLQNLNTRHSFMHSPNSSKNASILNSNTSPLERFLTLKLFYPKCSALQITFNIHYEHSFFKSMTG